MRLTLLLLGLFISSQAFSQTDIKFFETITAKPIDEIDAQLTDFGYSLTKSDSAQKFFVWQNHDQDGFTYQKGLFKVAKRSKGNSQASVTLRPQLIFKFLTSDKDKYYSIQTSLNNSITYLKGTLTQTSSGIKTIYTNESIEVALEKMIFKDEGDLYRVTFIINHPK